MLLLLGGFLLGGSPGDAVIVHILVGLALTGMLHQLPYMSSRCSGKGISFGSVTVVSEATKRDVGGGARKRASLPIRFTDQQHLKIDYGVLLEKEEDEEVGQDLSRR